MSLKNLSILCFLFLIRWYDLRAQQFPVQKLTVEEGLGHSIVYRTYQTANGYLWFSTDNGLTRFDGKSFTNYTGADGLGSNFILDLEEWDNKLYISTFGAGLVVMDSGRFKPLRQEGPLFPIDLTTYHDELWIIDRYKSLYRYDQKRFLRVDLGELAWPQDSQPGIFKVQKSSDGGLYLATQYGLYYFKDNVYKKILIPGVAPETSVMTLLELPNGNLILATPDKLLEFDRNNNITRTWLENEAFGRENTLFQDAEGNIWVPTLNGKLFLCQQGPYKNKNILVFEGTVINHIFQDKENNIWLATYGEGAWCIRSIYVRNYSIRSCIVSDVMTDRKTGNIIITSTNAGLKLLRQDESTYLLPSTDKRLERFFRTRRFLITALPLPNGSLLFSSDHKLYNFRKNKIDSLEAARAISTLYFQQKKNRLWIGSRFDLAYSDSLLQNFTHVPGFEKQIVRSVTEMSDGNALVGTDAGIYVEDNNGFHHLPDSAGRPYYVNALFREEHTGKIWVGTNEGLAWLEGRKLKWVDHPPAKVRCNSITSDHAGNVWVGTVNGLLRIYQDKIELITPKEGIAQLNILKIISEPEQNLLMLLSPNALSVLYTDKFLKNPAFELPDILIEKVVFENESFTNITAPIHVNNKVKDVSIFVSSPMIKNRDKIVFSYRVNGNEWTPFDGQKINIHSLPFGEMEITIRTRELFKPDHVKTSTVLFIVERPFYFTWWFILILGVILLGAISWIVIFYSRKKNLRLVEENKRLDVEHKALRNLLNPHFLYNAINSIHAFILQNDQRKTLAYLAKFSQLVRLNLELLATDRVALDKELKNISLYLEFEKLRFAEKLNYQIRIDPAVANSPIQIPSFIIQPFLENAIWHGLLPRAEGGNLVLQVEQQQNELVITIDDDGVGINTSLKTPKQDLEEKTSMGINIIRERIELLKKFQGHYGLMILDKSELNGKANGTGTIVKITVPVDKN
jgi:ligand-binding sensor domain-containing protein